MNVSFSNETLNQTVVNLPVVNTPSIQTLIVAIIFLLFFVGYGVFILYRFIDILGDLYNQYKFKRNRKEFFKLSLNLIRSNNEVTNLDPLILNITDLYKHSLRKSELDPNFINSLVANLEYLKNILLKNDLEICGDMFQDDDDNAILNHYLSQINEIISIVKKKNPFSGLNEDELSFFKQFEFDINKGDKDILIKKLIELSKMVKKKNNDILNLDKKTADANRWAIIGTVVAVIGIIVAFLLWLLK
jgi:hypothetical protein